MTLEKPELPVSKKLMFHTVIHINSDNIACGVEITTNPYEHSVKAALIIHKTSSLNVAKQVARYVRRATGQRRASVHRAGQTREAMIGYAVNRTHQFAPNERTPYRDIVSIVSSTSVADLLKLGDVHDNASRSRFYVFEVRDGSLVLGRFVSNKLGSVEKLFLSAPPDQRPNASIHAVFHSPVYEDALKECGTPFKYIELWTRKPPRSYLDKVLRTNAEGDYEYVSNGFSAMRKYSSGTFVQVGPHLYTHAQMLAVMKFGEWEDGRVTRRALAFMGTKGVTIAGDHEKFNSKN